MSKILFKNKFHYLLLIFTSIFSYYLFLIYYDSTTGLDWSKYSTFINHYVFGTALNAKDGQSIIYYYLIAKVISFNLDSLNEINKNILLSNGIQLGNFLLQIIGFFGIYKYYLSLKYNKKYIVYALSIINFFPPLIYLRLSYKSEMLAFALLPWVLFLLNKLKVQNFRNFDKILLIATSSILLTIKPSITIMVSLFILFLHHDIVNNNKNLILAIGMVSILLLFLNFQIVKIDFITHNTEETRWDNVATASFFYTVNIKSLILEPIYNIQSKSLISVMLLDTFGDYFTYFWKHKEPTNFLAFDQIDYFNNFHLNRYLRDYIAISLSIFTYFCCVYNYYKIKNQIKKIFVGPFIPVTTKVKKHLKNSYQEKELRLLLITFSIVCCFTYILWLYENLEDNALYYIFSVFGMEIFYF